VRAHALALQRRAGAADAAYRALAFRDPNNWQVHLEWAQVVAFFGHDPVAAAQHYARARQLNPRLPAPATLGG
jgi:hypothetical protein